MKEEKDSSSFERCPRAGRSAAGHPVPGLPSGPASSGRPGPGWTTLAADISLHYNVLLAPRVIGVECWERMKRAGLSLYRNVATEGIPLPLPALRAA
jgi:hypothetical protein